MHFLLNLIYQQIHLLLYTQEVSLKKTDDLYRQARIKRRLYFVYPKEEEFIKTLFSKFGNNFDNIINYDVFYIVAYNLWIGL